MILNGDTQGDIILGCLRWYCKYGISYRDLEEMMDLIDDPRLEIVTTKRVQTLNEETLVSHEEMLSRFKDD